MVIIVSWFNDAKHNCFFQSCSQNKETRDEGTVCIDPNFPVSRGPAGRVDSMVIDSDVSNYTLSSLFPATEYEISLNAVRGSQESKVVSTSVFTGRTVIRKHYQGTSAWNESWAGRQPIKFHLHNLIIGAGNCFVHNRFVEG